MQEVCGHELENAQIGIAGFKWSRGEQDVKGALVWFPADGMSSIS